MHSKVAILVRQKALDKFFEQFRRIYEANVLPTIPDLAHRHALEQEQKVLDSTVAQMYKQETGNVLARLKRRPNAVSAEDVGIEGKYKSPKELEKLRAARGPVAAAALKPFVLSEKERADLNYYSLDLSTGPLPPAEEAERETKEKTCDRCGGRFIPHDELQEGDLEACKFHPLRARYEKPTAQGEKVRSYPCCGSSENSALFEGCSTGPHVFVESDYALLHFRQPFVKLLPRDDESSAKHAVVACDCEMVYTSAGFEVARVSIVDGKGDLLVDSFVKPSGTVRDLNTRWSGITPDHIEHPDAMTFEQLRDKLNELMDSETIIVGHGLENDLRVLRLHHEAVVDTVALFPHPRGLPIRNSLRYLVERYLGKSVQQSSAGHDSVEDARSALELVQHFLKQEKNKAPSKRPVTSEARKQLEGDVA
jgi:RNA exonuclease 1